MQYRDVIDPDLIPIHYFQGFYIDYIIDEEHQTIIFNQLSDSLYKQEFVAEIMEKINKLSQDNPKISKLEVRSRYKLKKKLLEAKEEFSKCWLSSKENHLLQRCFKNCEFISKDAIKICVEEGDKLVEKCWQQFIVPKAQEHFNKINQKLNKLLPSEQSQKAE